MLGRILAAAVLLAAVLSCTGSHAESKGPAPCVASQFATASSAEIMAGRVSFVGLPAVPVGKDVDWRMDPHRNRSWALTFHSLRWMGRLVVDYETTGREAYLERATEIARDWVRDNPRGGRGVSEWAWADHPVALRTPALVCLSRHVGDRWLADSLAEHADYLADPRLYKKGHNHGLDQDLALAAAGCRLSNTRWRDLAARRMAESAELAIDRQGVLQEQAPRYAIYVHERLGLAFDTMRTCGSAVPARLAERRASLAEYIAQSTQPDGRLAPIGDSPADLRPRGYPHSADRVKVFDAGYVYGRTAWDDPGSAYYSIRFGPGRKMHGHEDHLGVTYHADRRDILVEAGFHSYEKSAYPKWTVTPEAHNVPVVDGRAFREGTATRLTRTAIGVKRQFFDLEDTAYGVSRTRKVLVNHGADLMAVRDAVKDGARLRTLWHFAPGLRVTANRGGTVVLADGAWRVTLTQFALPSCRPLGGQSVRRGEISPGYLKRVPSATVVSRPARSVLTVIVPGTGDPRAVTCADGVVTARTPDGPVSFAA
ncbi:heparinase II/III family protein [Nonomuraea sp. NPDC046570]|uniref:heparinase II/III family protein n=1 Tax=Nonomuraea sp. NPDC046570 TaxID=3155255 RepID=UPI0033DB6C0B